MENAVKAICQALVEEAGLVISHTDKICRLVPCYEPRLFPAHAICKLDVLCDVRSPAPAVESIQDNILHLIQRILRYGSD